MQTANLIINGMSCKHCVQTIEKTLSALPGVTQVAVDLPGAKASVSYAPEKVSVEQLVASVNAAGYEARPA